MSSYHSKFKYLGRDSKEDLGWIIAHFDADSGETDSYLSQEQVYTDSYNGHRRILYGTKWNAVAVIKITVIKQDGSGFNLSECREAYRWLTGSPNASWLDLYVEDELKYSYSVTVQDVKPYKLDARTVGMNIYFESISPWAYSPLQTVSYSLEQSLSMTSDGTLYLSGESASFGINNRGVLYNTNEPQLTFSDDTVYLDNSSKIITINNLTDDLYSYIYLNTVVKNKNCTNISIANLTLNEETTINDILGNEIITLSANQFIVSDNTGKKFGNTFNYIWPRLAPGINELQFSGDGEGVVIFTYRYPIKVGDSAMDIEVSSGGLDIC